jgi:orotate phosphoribosyltransferase
MSSSAQAIAERLLQIEAVKLNLSTPFTWASGWKSPVYCDNRRVLSFPVARDLVKSEMCRVIFEQFPDADAIAGVATAGIAWGAMAADQLKLPFLYVRSKPKEHGMGNQIEGVVKAGQKLIVVEDLVSTGKSSLSICEALRAAGAEVLAMICIFTYGFDASEEAFQKAGIPLVALTNYSVLSELAKDKGLIQEDQMPALIQWREHPSGWGQ